MDDRLLRGKGLSEDQLEEMDHTYREILRDQRDEAIRHLRFVFMIIDTCTCMAEDEGIEAVKAFLSKHPNSNNDEKGGQN